MTHERSNPADLVDLADSLDIRHLLAGRISPAGIPIRRDRTELAAVLDRASKPDREVAADDLERTSP